MQLRIRSAKYLQQAFIVSEEGSILIMATLEGLPAFACA